MRHCRDCRDCRDGRDGRDGRGRRGGVGAARAALWLVAAACVAVPVRVPGGPETRPEAPASSGGPAAVGAEACLSASERRVARLINELRREQDLGELTVDAALSRAAASHARDMAANDFFGHEGSEGSEVGERTRRQGYAWRAVGENIAAGWSQPDVAVDGWWHSAGHRRNLLGASYRHLGVGHVEVIGSRYTHYWVTVYAAPGARSDSGTPC